MNWWVILAIVSLVLAGISGITQKLSTNHVSFEMSFFYFSVAMAVISLGVPFVASLKWRTLTVGEGMLITSGGLLNGLGVFTSFAAFERGGRASVIVPIINLYPLVTVLGAWLLFGDLLTGRQIFGLFLALAAVLLLSRENTEG